MKHNEFAILYATRRGHMWGEKNMFFEDEDRLVPNCSRYEGRVVYGGGVVYVVGVLW